MTAHFQMLSALPKNAISLCLLILLKFSDYHIDETPREGEFGRIGRPTCIIKICHTRWIWMDGWSQGIILCFLLFLVITFYKHSKISCPYKIYF